MKQVWGAAVLCVFSLNLMAADRSNLVIEGIPDIPVELAERMNQYQQVRTATFQGWLGRDGALISTRFGETSQLHRVAFPLAMREQITFFPEPVGAAAPAPDGSGILFTKDRGGDEAYQIYYFEAATGQTRRLTDGTARNTDPLWSNDSRKFAYATTRRNGTDTDIHVMTQDGKSHAVLEDSGTWMPLDWLPDDSALLVMRYISATESELYLLDVDALQIVRFHETKSPASLGPARFSRDGKGVYFVSDEGSEFRQLRYEDLATGNNTILTSSIPWDVEEIALSRGGTYLAYSVNEGGRSQLYAMDLKRNVAMTLPSLPMGTVGGLEFDLSGKQLGFYLNGPRNATDMYSVEMATASLTRWTRSETGGLQAQAFTEPVLKQYPSFDQRNIPAWVYKPQGNGPFPVLINIHGGPEAQTLATFAPLTEYYVREMGIAVIYPNVRGSSGYGKSYLKLDNGFQREDAVKDIGALLDWIAQQPDLDKNRVAVIGGSYGGYMSLASMAAYNDRLRAGIDIVGISNFVTFLTNTGDYRRDLRRVEYGDERDAEMRAFLEKISPTANADKISKPMFIIQGANDPRVPASEAEQMVKTIRAQGGDVWYLLAKDEGHGFQKKSNRDFYTNAVVLFLQKHLLAATASGAASVISTPAP